MAKRDIIAIGGSAGSGAVLRKLFAGLPADFPASLFVSTHVPSQSAGHLADALGQAGAFPVAEAVDGQPVEQGCAYVAVADRHLLLVGGTIRLGAGPRENLVRPAIDAMFRSAALDYGPRVVGVVLTGLLNDGASGLAAIKACGGTAIVQHPIDAQADQMPLAALEAVDADHVVVADRLADLLVEVAATDTNGAPPPPPGLALEVDIAMGKRTGAAKLSEIATPSALSCPDCGGVLSEIDGDRPLRFRCQIGHAYTADVLASGSEAVDEALRIALRVMEERVTLVTRMAADARQSGRTAVAELYEARADEYGGYAATLREAATLAHRMGAARRDQEV